MRTLLTHGRILTPASVNEGVDVILEDGLIAAVVPAGSASGEQVVDLAGRTLVPGFIDTQVNGGGGRLFNDEPTADCVAAIGEAHRRFGTTGFLPTVISDDLKVVDQAIDAVQTALDQGVPGVLGIHIEGPFLNERRKGIHDASKIRALQPQFVERLTRLRGGRTLITLAPEMTTPEMIRQLVQSGALVSAGHTDADYRTMRAAFDAGLSAGTHLFNAMSSIRNREPGVVGAFLENQTAWCGLIVDGIHVDPVVMRLALRCRPLDRFMLVTDAMSSIGADIDHFFLQGRRITVSDGKCVDSAGVLAGSALDMAAAVRNAMEMLDIDLSQAAMMASGAPAAFLGCGDRRGAIAPGYAADLVLLDDDFRVAQTWIGGRHSSERLETSARSDALETAQPGWAN